MTHAYPAAEFGLWGSIEQPPAIPGVYMDPEVMRLGMELNKHRFMHLTYKQRMFCDYFLLHKFDPVQAAILIGALPDEANRIGRAMLRQPHVATAIDLACQYHAASTNVDLRKVVLEIAKLAFADMGKFFKRDENGEPFVVLPDEDDPAFAAVSEITIETYMEGRGDTAREVKKTRFKTYDKLRALDMLMKFLKPDAPTPGAPAAGNTHVSVSHTVNTINLVPVPSGAFIPPSEPAALPKHTPLIEGYISRAESPPTIP